jgi:hypothetical protein
MNDPRILCACPFCGEREHLRIDEGGFPRASVRDGQVEEIVWRGCQVVSGEEHVDAIYCLVCDSVAALDVWNHTRPASDYALLRDFDPPEPEAEALRQAVAA